MTAIERVETILIDVPTIRPHILAMATMYRQTLCLVRIHCADGIVGIGEATTGATMGPPLVLAAGKLAGDPQAKLQWLYQRLPYYDQNYLKYPVLIE